MVIYVLVTTNTKFLFYLILVFTVFSVMKPQNLEIMITVNIFL